MGDLDNIRSVGQGVRILVICIVLAAIAAIVAFVALSAEVRTRDQRLDDVMSEFEDASSASDNAAR